MSLVIILVVLFCLSMYVSHEWDKMSDWTVVRTMRHGIYSARARITDGAEEWEVLVTSNNGMYYYPDFKPIPFLEEVKYDRIIKKYLDEAGM